MQGVEVAVGNRDIPIHEMLDGQIGVITSWGAGDDSNNGIVVQRYRDILFSIGRPSGHSWTTAIESKSQDNRVCIIDSGTLLKVK